MPGDRSTEQLFKDGREQAFRECGLERGYFEMTATEVLALAEIFPDIKPRDALQFALTGKAEMCGRKVIVVEKQQRPTSPAKRAPRKAGGVPKSTPKK